MLRTSWMSSSSAFELSWLDDNVEACLMVSKGAQFESTLELHYLPPCGPDLEPVVC